MNENTKAGPGNPETPYVEVSDGTFQVEVVASTQPVLVDFWAPWCGPCRMIGPVVEELAREYAGRAKVAKIDVDRNPEVAARYGISSIPTLMVFQGGQVVEQIVGLASKRDLARRIDAHLN
jgi:thioredoxin 1